MDGVAIAHEDADLLVVIKPAGIATTAPDGGDSLTARLCAARRETLHPTSRLDLEVTGLVTYARTKRAIAWLMQARERGAYRRGYLALASQSPNDDTGEWVASIAIDPRDRRGRVVAERGERLQQARTAFRVRARIGAIAAALWLTPFTGRTHQLRVHAAHAGVPLLGDTRYGGPRRLALLDGQMVRAARTMLHCAWLELPAIEGGTIELAAAAPSDLRTVWLALGGDEAALTPRP